MRTAAADLRGMGRLGWALLRGRVPLADLAEALGRTTARSAGGRLSAQLVVFALIGILSTLAYALLYVALRGTLGAQEANALALAATAIANTAANRRFTFGVKGRDGALRHQLQGLLVFACGLGVTSGSLWALRAVSGDGHPLVEVILLTAANLFVTVMRFVVMRVWMFRGRSTRAVRAA